MKIQIHFLRLRGMPSAWVTHLSSHINHCILDFQNTSSRLSEIVLSTASTATCFLSFPFSYLWKSLPLIFRHLLHVRRIPPPYSTYKNTEEEEKYWKEAESGQKVLQHTDARYVGSEAPKRRCSSAPSIPPLVMYYTPALPPKYRDAPRKKKEVKTYHISTKNYCKWHWMVFPGDDHPDHAEANKLKTLHSASELQMIDHIARMLPDRKVFAGGACHRRARPWVPRYQQIWLEFFNAADRTT